MASCLNCICSSLFCVSDCPILLQKHFVGRVKGECVLHFGMCSGYYFLLGLPQPRMNVMNNLSSNPCGRGNLRELITNVSIYSGHSVAEGRVASLMIRRWATEKAAGSSKKWS